MSDSRWDKYDVKETPIGSGKKGEIFEAYDHEYKRRVAIKRLYNTEKAKLEATVMQAYGTHDFLPQYYDFFILDGQAHIVMELIHGASLRKISKKYKEKKAIQLTINILEGLKQLHQSGYVHSDISLGNIMLDHQQSNLVKIIDFGSAKAKNEHGYFKGKHTIRKSKISPIEQRKPFRKITDTTDLYTVACICTCLLTGHLPTFNNKTKSHNISVKNKELQKVLRKATHRKRKKRYQTAQQMIDALQKLN